MSFFGELLGLNSVMLIEILAWLFRYVKEEDDSDSEMVVDYMSVLMLYIHKRRSVWSQ